MVVRLRILILIGFVGILASCKTTKITSLAGSIPAMNVSRLLDSIETRSNFDNLSSKVIVSYTTEKESRSFSARVRIKKDSLVWVSIAPVMGIELFRLSVSRDTVKLLNRTNQTYFTRDYNEAKELLKLDIDFHSLQDILLGESLSIYNDDQYLSVPTPNGFQLRSDSAVVQLAVESGDTASAFNHFTDINTQSWKVEKTELVNALNEEHYLASYSNFEPFVTGFFPIIMNFNIDGREKISVNLKWTKLEEKPNLNFPFRIPAKYEPVQ